jgi:DNA-directed RNA polymerase subunit K/omega
MDNDTTSSEIDDVQETVDKETSEDEISETEGGDDIIGDESEDFKSDADDGTEAEDGQADDGTEAEDGQADDGQTDDKPEESASANIPIEYEFITERSKNQLHKDVVIIDPKNRKTSNMISKTELVEAIGVRAAQIAQKATVFVDINIEKKSNGVTSKIIVDDPIVMAKMEVAQKKSPLILRRVVKTKTDPKTGKITEWVEDWPIRDMLLPASLKLV